MGVTQTGLTVLLVEDEPLLRRVLAETLEESGFTVEQADTGDSAWEMVRNGLSFDVVLTDVRMPGRLNGIDLVFEIRQMLGDVPAVIMSGYSEYATAPTMGRSAFFRKPFRAVELTRTVLRLADA